MQTYLLNSAIMPANCYGTYTYTPATVADLTEALQAGTVISRIGYDQTAAMIHQWTGCPVAVSRDEMTFAPGDAAYVVRLRYRIANPGTKGAPVSTDPADWEIARIQFAA